MSLALLDELHAARATISPWHLLRQVLLAQFLPLALGVGLGQMHDPAAARLRPRLARVGRWLLGALALLAAALNSAPPGVKATLLACLVVAALTVTPFAICRSRYS